MPAANFVLAAIFCASRNICVLFVLLLYVPKSTTLAIARRSAHLITSFLGNHEEAVNQYFVMGARVLDLRPSGQGVRASLVAFHCALKQDAFILAEYWFNPGRPVPI